jgi:thermitase
MPTENHLHEQEQQVSPFQVQVRGFTLELQEKSDQKQTEDWEKCRREVWQQVVEVVKVASCLELAPEKLHLLNHDSYSPDLMEIAIKSELTIAQVWDFTYHLRRLPKVIYAEPRFSLLIPNQAGRSGRKALANQPARHLPKSENFEWCLSLMQVQKAWEEFFPTPDKIPGQGVVIGHPDTGYVHHPELEKALGIREGFNFSESDEIQQNQYPINGRNNNFPANQVHGTATASLMISPKNFQAKQKQGNNKDVIGIAYGADIIPLRIQPCGEDDEVFSPGLAAAINKAADLNVDIISISMGGYPSLAVRKAIVNAQKKGIIIVASAGHGVPFAVWPAAYEQVIAVAACDVEGKPAEFSSRGSRVDVTAPGESVWCATAEMVNGELTYTVKQLSGTSFSAALVSSVAALWLSYHGRDELIKRYGAMRVPLVFDKLLRQTCCVPDEWDKNNWGAGIVNAYKLLDACLPEVDDPVIQIPLAFGNVEHVLLDRGGFQTFTYLFEQTLSNLEFINKAPLDIVQRVLSKLLGQSGKNLRMYLRTFGQEIAFHFGIDPSLYKLMENALKLEAGFQELPEDNLDKVRDELSKNVSVSKYLKDYLPSTAAPT